VLESSLVFSFDVPCINFNFFKLTDLVMVVHLVFTEHNLGGQGRHLFSVCLQH